MVQWRFATAVMAFSRVRYKWLRAPATIDSKPSETKLVREFFRFAWPAEDAGMFRIIARSPCNSAASRRARRRGGQITWLIRLPRVSAASDGRVVQSGLQVGHLRRIQRRGVRMQPHRVVWGIRAGELRPQLPLLRFQLIEPRLRSL
jgi:hypothetical protein